MKRSTVRLQRAPFGPRASAVNPRCELGRTLRAELLKIEDSRIAAGCPAQLIITLTKAMSMLKKVCGLKYRDC